MRNIEYVNLDESSDIEIMPNGFASMMAMLTRTGILTYQQIDPDGTVKIIRQLRLPDEVFSEETMSTLAGIPLTNNHPEELVNPANASDYIVGMASDNPKRVFAPVQGDSEEYVQQRLTIFDESTIGLIRNKQKTQLSLGYSCELEFEPGEYKGENYDAIQRNIRVNHAALVQRARGGPNCKVIMKDGAEETINLDGETLLDTHNNPSKEKNVKIFNFDGKEYKVEDDAYSLLDSLQTKLKEAADLSKSKQSEIEKLTAANDDYKSQIKNNKDSDDQEKFLAAVKSRVALEGKGSKILGSEINLDALSDREIKEQVIKKLRPETILDEKSDEYVEARFEICVEDAAEKVEEKKEDSDKKMGRGIQNQDDDDVTDSKKARAKAWDYAKNQWKEGNK